MNIVLASASPRRAELLRQIGVAFTVEASDIDENSVKANEPPKWVQYLALEKAKDVAKRMEAGLVLGADTIVVKEEKILGKPQSPEDALKMLEFLSGSVHEVMTGFALVDAFSQKIITDVEITKVKFRKLTLKEIQAYIASGEPMDKAGAYGIQGLGCLLVEGISGCYFNVVGLPLNRVAQHLKHFGVETLV